MAGYSDIAQRFLDLHVQGRPLLLANAWDRGSARVLADAGFRALATTSSGHAATLGKPDGAVTREEAIAHAGDIAAATDLPLSADLENGFGDEPEAVAETVRLALEVGLAGCSIEDCARDAETIYERERAVERVAAAAEAAHAGAGLVLTARSENHIRGNPDLEDTIERLRGYQEAGADVLYAPGLKSIEEIREVVAAVDRPVNVLALPGAPPVADLAAAGVSRVSVGGGFAFTALGALATAARELIDAGTYGFWGTAKLGAQAARSAFES